MRTTLVVILLFGCTGTGELTVLLDAEDSITAGIDPGSASENVVDGWEVRFDRYLVMIGDVRVSRSVDELSIEDPSIRAVDLAMIGSTGHTLTRFSDVLALRWDVFEYDTRSDAAAVVDGSVSATDFTAMVENGWTYLIDGTIRRADGQSCPPGGACRSAPSLTFRLGANVDARFGPCEAEDGLSGVTVAEGATTVSVTIHGDHVFFTAFPAGAEVIERRAQWLADADIDGDNHVTMSELSSIPIAELFAPPTYTLAGSPLTPLTTAADYVRAQLATQGHFQGEGECPVSIVP